jgi:hypothetical protein
MNVKNEVHISDGMAGLMHAMEEERKRMQETAEPTTSEPVQEDVVHADDA